MQIDPGESVSAELNSAAPRVIACALCGAYAWLATRGDGGLFVWGDVALVALAGAIPASELGLGGFAGVGGVFGTSRRSLTTLAPLAVYLAALLVAVRGAPSAVEIGGPQVVRTLVAWAAAVAAVALGRSLGGRFGNKPKNRSGAKLERSIGRATAPPTVMPRAAKLLAATAGGLLLVLAPAAYSAAKQARLEARLLELDGQSRTRVAFELAERLARFAPSSRPAGREVAEWREQLRQQVDRLTANLASAEGPDVSDERRLERARSFAQLDDLEQTARTLAPLVLRDAPSPDACLLMAAAYEMNADWEASRSWHARAAAVASNAGASNADASSSRRRLAEAYRGLGYAERKLGRYRHAEEAYQNLLALAPTAETHILLATFYEEGQQGDLARRHAETAWRLDPERFEQASRSLIAQTAVSHFGCWTPAHPNPKRKRGTPTSSQPEA